MPMFKQPPAANSKLPRKLHYRRFAILLAVAIVLGGGSYYLHAYQVQRHAHALLDRAHQSDADGKLEEATEYMRRYLRLQPRDSQALGEYGLLLAKAAHATGSRRAFESALLTLENAL